MEGKFECSQINILAQIAKDNINCTAYVFTEYERDNGDNFRALV
jgi:hypothetical protein